MSCCRCNREGTCKSCSCVKDGRACSNCLPKRLGSCVNCVNAALGAHIPTLTPNSAHPPPVAALQSTSTSTSQPRRTHNSPEHPLTAMTQRPTSVHQPLTAARIDLLPSSSRKLPPCNMSLRGPEMSGLALSEMYVPPLWPILLIWMVGLSCSCYPGVS